MTEEGTAAIVVAEQTEDHTDSKKKRKRLKQLCKQVRQQMEFYFGDANLSKDRFIKQQVSQSPDGYIDLEMFLNFNKIKCLTTELSVLAKALSSSTLLQVSDDGQKVRRTKPLGNYKDVDERTVYVECVPASTDHIWLRGIFEQAGKVLYVSLPRYRTTKDIKGFAFIEYETPEEALKACQLLNNPPPDAPNKAGKFPKFRKQLKQLEKQVAKQKSSDGGIVLESLAARKGRRKRTLSDSVVEEHADQERPVKKMKRRRRTQSEGSEDLDAGHAPLVLEKKEIEETAAEGETKKEKAARRKKKRNSSGLTTETGEVVTEQPSDADQEPPLKVKKVDDVKEVEEKKTDADNKSEDVDDSEVKKAKKRRHEDGSEEVNAESEDKKETKRVRICTEQVEVVKTESKKKRKKKKKTKEKVKDTPELRVIPKKDWLELKNEYLSLQKENMKQLKESLCQHKDKIKKADNKGKADKKADNKGKADKHLEFVADVIIKVTSTEPLTRKELKEKTSQHGSVAYIDLLDGDNEAYIRCNDPDSASKIQASTIEDCELVPLEGEEEQDYWKKILADREKKMNTKTRSKKRGKERVMVRAEKVIADISKKKHVVFDED